MLDICRVSVPAATRAVFGLSVLALDSFKKKIESASLKL